MESDGDAPTLAGFKNQGKETRAQDCGSLWKLERHGDGASRGLCGHQPC